MENLLTAAVIILIIFLIGREFFCWYSKQNEIVSLLKDTNNLLRSIGNIEEIKPQTQTKLTKCGHCGKANVKGLPNCVACGKELKGFSF